MTPTENDDNQAQKLLEQLQEIVKAINGLNDKLNYLCTQGIFVKIDEDINEN